MLLPRAASPAAVDPPWLAFREAYFLLRERWTDELGRFGLSYSDYVVLDRLAQAPTRASDVGRSIGITAAGATDLIDRLAGRRLVRRVADPDDRRAIRVQLTPVGRRLRDDALSAKRALIGDLDAAMTGEEQRALARGLAALTRALRGPARRTARTG